jgi:beta-fructofuranosidase
MKWEFIGTLLQASKKEKVNQGINWECPNLLPLKSPGFGTDSQWLALISVQPTHQVIYALGSIENGKFYPNHWNYLDFSNIFYATNVFHGVNDRHLVIGWIKGGGTGGWDGCLSLVREIYLNSNGELCQHPANEYKQMRKHEYSFSASELKPNVVIPNVISDLAEILISFSGLINLQNGRIGLKIIKDQFTVPITYDFKSQKITCGDQVASIPKAELIDANYSLTLNIFFDRSIIEVFLNEKFCITCRCYPNDFTNEKKWDGFILMENLPYQHSYIKKFIVWELNLPNDK